MVFDKNDFKTLIEPTSYPILMIEISVRSEVWCASNGSVSVLRGDTIIDKFDVPEVGKAPLSAGACIASGVWVARGDLAYLYLYHVHTKTMIQTYDLSKAAFEVQRVHSSFGISSLTTIGMLLILPVIRDHFRSFETISGRFSGQFGTISSQFQTTFGKLKVTSGHSRPLPVM